MEISNELIEAVKTFLGAEGIDFFRTCRTAHGSLAPILVESVGETTVYHPVHFVQGTQIRKFMASTGLCPDWKEQDFFQNWTMVVAKSIE